MCRWYSAGLASIPDEETYDFLVQYVDALEPTRDENLPEGHPVAELWWTSGHRVGEDWTWAHWEPMKFAPWLRIDSPFCRNCHFPEAAVDSHAVVLSNFDGEYGFANVPISDEYDYPYPLCEKPCANILGDN
jgi:hypothetical protein